MHRIAMHLGAARTFAARPSVTIGCSTSSTIARTSGAAAASTPFAFISARSAARQVLVG